MKIIILVAVILCCEHITSSQGAELDTQKKTALYSDFNITNFIGREVICNGTLKSILLKNAIFVDLRKFGNDKSPDSVISGLGLDKSKVMLIESMVINGYSAERYRVSSKFELIVLSQIRPKKEGGFAIKGMSASLVPAVSNSYMKYLLDVQRRDEIIFRANGDSHIWETNTSSKKK